MANYKLGWSENHPGHVVYLLDLSESMGWNGKIDNVISAVSGAIKNCILEASGTGETENQMSITIIGYNSEVTTIIDNETLKDLVDKYNVKTLLNKTTNAVPKWQTFTASAFDAAAKDIEEWIEKQRKEGKPQPAPMVIHITDGYPYEDESCSFALSQARSKALESAKRLKSIKTEDGNVRLFNIHIEPQMPNLLFPSSRPSGTKPKDEAMQFMYDSASFVDDKLIENCNILIKPGIMEKNSRLMVSNVDTSEMLTKLISFGSTPGSSKPNPFHESPMIK